MENIFENVRTNVTVYFERRINKNSMTDYHIWSVYSTDLDKVPPVIQRNDKRCSFIVVGQNLPVLTGIPIRLYGKWDDSRKRYGMQFKADSYEYVNPDTVSGIIKFLSSSNFPGIGQETAKKVAAMFGLDTFDVIENHPGMLWRAVKASQAATIAAGYKASQKYGRLTAFLAPYGIPSRTIVNVLDTLGNDAVAIIKRNPYKMMDVKGVGFKTCDKIARDLGVQLDAYIRISGCVDENLHNLCARGGHMYVKHQDLYRAVMVELNKDFNPAPVSAERYMEVIRDMYKNKKIVIRFNEDVFPKEYDVAEHDVSEKLTDLLQHPLDAEKVESVKEELDKYCKESGINLHETQAEAVIRSLSNRVSIITGGPGTGKTTIISAILNCYETLFGGEIIQMAPTGKAARRMSESTKRDASTIHSRLKLYGANGMMRAPSPIESGLIVIDECSMVDGLLMEQLMEAIASYECHVIFVGDIDQLPSVGVGAVLGEMINSGVIPTSRLTKTFRQKDGGGTIIENAKKINTGKFDLEYDETFQLVQAGSDHDAARIITELYRKEVAERGIENVALLCPLRNNQGGKFECVADTMNERLQGIINPPAANLAEAKICGKQFRVGDRVMQWKNTEESANGDIGEIKAITNSVDEGILVSVDWENGNHSILTSSAMADITMAYALSIHKSQGSEYQSVIIPVLDQQTCDMFKRNLLYTGVTRAKKKVILVGDVPAINKCIFKTDTNIRNTHLAARLKSHAANKGLTV